MQSVMRSVLFQGQDGRDSFGPPGPKGSKVEPTFNLMKFFYQIPRNLGTENVNVSIYYRCCMNTSSLTDGANSPLAAIAEEVEDTPGSDVIKRPPV